MNNNVSSLKVLHLASFAGNIGDLANHTGARLMFAKHLDFGLSVTELEIREFYWKQRSFDEEFIRYANSFDLLIIGGGNYFELWVQNSATGTSIDISPGLLAALTVPTVFYSLGVDTGQGYTQQAASRFRAFMSEVLSRESMFACVRNDGSSLALQDVLGKPSASKIPMMPDGGFFALEKKDLRVERDPSVCSVGVNLAGDMLERRFNGEISYKTFLEDMARAFTTLLDAKDNLEFELIPHIWRDVSLIADLLPLIPDKFIRRRVSIAPLIPVKAGLSYFLNRYNQHDLVLGMRFHSNVCSIGMNTPTIGLLNYPQVAMLYEELQLQDRLVDVRRVGFGDDIERMTLRDLDNLPAIRSRYHGVISQVNYQAAETLGKLNAWMHARFD